MLKKAGRYAPTAQNRQAFEYVVVHDPQQVDTLRRLTIDTHRSGRQAGNGTEGRKEGRHEQNK